MLEFKPFVWDCQKKNSQIVLGRCYLVDSSIYAEIKLCRNGKYSTDIYVYDYNHYHDDAAYNTFDDAKMMLEHNMKNIVTTLYSGLSKLLYKAG